MHPSVTFRHKILSLPRETRIYNLKKVRECGASIYGESACLALESGDIAKAKRYAIEAYHYALLAEKS